MATFFKQTVDTFQGFELHPLPLVPGPGFEFFELAKPLPPNNYNNAGLIII
jgi:hypothetical protein